MRLTNTSRLRTEEILPLLQFVESRCRFASFTNITVVDAPKRKKVSGGIAVLNPREGSAVTIHFSQAISYPFLSHHPTLPNPPVALISSWQEAFLHIAAHELRHIDQFVTGWFTGGKTGPTVDDAERDAECFAIWMLSEYRESALARRTA